MKISFIIPAFNEENFLGSCLESIFSQKIPGHEVEVIVVNNASTDNTKEVALSFPGVKVVDEPRKGLTFARQAGFLASTGDLIAQLDADSKLPAGWAQKVLQKFMDNPELSGVSGPVVYYDLSAIQNFFVRIYYYLAYTSYLLNRYILKVSSLVQGSNFVARRNSLAAIGGYDTGIAFYGEDTDLAKRINKVGPVDFSLAVPVYTSARRFKSEGILVVASRYVLNYFWVIFFNQPFSHAYTDIRTEK